MDTQPHENGAGAKPGDHKAHEQQLAAALRDLIRQIDLSEYRDGQGQPIRESEAFRKAQQVVDQFGLTHEQLCETLDACDLEGGLEDAARRLVEERTASPSSTPPEYNTWRTGP